MSLEKVEGIEVYLNIIPFLGVAQDNLPSIFMSIVSFDAL